MKLLIQEKISQGERWIRSTATSSRHSSCNHHRLLRRGAFAGRKLQSVPPTDVAAVSPAPRKPAAPPACSPGQLCFQLLALQSAAKTQKYGCLRAPPRTGASPASDTDPGDQQHWACKNFGKYQTEIVLNCVSVLSWAPVKCSHFSLAHYLGSQCHCRGQWACRTCTLSRLTPAHAGHGHQPLLAPHQRLHSRFQLFPSATSFWKVSLIAGRWAGLCCMGTNLL